MENSFLSVEGAMEFGGHGQECRRPETRERCDSFFFFFFFKFKFLSRLASVWTGRLVIYYTST